MATTNIIGLKNTGIVSYDGAGVFAGRTLTAGSSKISITNGNGVAGNPTLDAVEANFTLNNIGGTLGISKGGTNNTSFTTNSVIYYDGTSLNSLGVMTDGQLIIGDTSDPPKIASVTAGTGITLTPGAGTLTISASSTSPLVFHTDGSDATPAANAITIAGGVGLTSTGSGSTVTVNLDSPVTVANGGTGDTTLTSHGVLYGNGTSPVGITAAGTDGQVLIGATGLAPAFGTITGSAGITLTPGANSLAISNVNIPNSALQNSSITINTSGIITGGGVVALGGTLNLTASATNFPWTEVTGTSQAMSIDNGYVANNGSLVTLTLPGTAVFGSVIRVVGKGAGLWRIAQNAGQSIRVGDSATTVGAGGSITSLLNSDSVELLCITANTLWVVISGGGTYTIV